MDGPHLAFLPVRVAGAPPVEICVDLDRDHDLTAWLLENDRMDDPVQRAFLGFVGQGSRVLDLGSHIGTFALPAAALGAEVIAVDESAAHADLLRRAVDRNGFENVHVIHGSIGDPWGAGAPIVTVDELLDRHGWDTLDAIKMDIEGAELLAVRGMSRFYARGARPPMVFECNGVGLASLRSSVYELRETVADLGYELLQIDHLRSGTLVEARPRGIQPECITDYLAVTSRPAALADEWTIEPPFSRERIVLRLLDTAARAGEWYRRYAAFVLLDGPAAVGDDPLVPPALRALELDIHSEVRGAFDHQGGEGAHTHAEAPEPGGAPEELAVLVLGVSLASPAVELDADGNLVEGRLLLADASFHVCRGELLEILVDDPAVGTELLRALAGLARPAAGRIETNSPPVFLPSLGDVLEPTLTVRENFLLMAAFLGGDVGATREHLGALARLARVESVIDFRLGEVLRPAEVAVKLAVTAALECTSAGVLLVDELAPVDDAGFNAWSARRTLERRREGLAVAQLRRAGGPNLGEPSRLLWIAGGEVAACGRPGGIVSAIRATRLGLARV